MAKRVPRLQFSEEELSDPVIRKAAEKADKAVDKLEKAESKIPKKKVKERVVSPDGKVTTRLSFEEKKPPSKLSHAARDAPVDALRGTVHRNIRETDDDNSGTDAANTLSETAESSYRIAETAHRSREEKPYREAGRTEAAADKANVRALEKEYGETEGYAANPYYICNVSLENFNLSHVPVYIMSQDQLSMYAMYMATLGNRPELFAASDYVRKYYDTEYEKYEIPPEALEDEQFALMIAEAEKYLGYPYVWGGSSPSTSFDCSDFVSWVCNNCGAGWNFGRLGAEGLRQICTRVSSANVKPGDLVFFQGTYDTTGASHVAIYVGDGMMIHCGDPIQYASLNTSYWQAHFLSYGRLPSP